MSLNYYKLLNISTNASEKEIKKAYRNLAKKYHPDTYEGDKSIAEKKMQQINEAYDTLSDITRRNEYDKKIGIYKETEQKANTNYNNSSSYHYQTAKNYNVKYKPNNSNTYYDRYGYAETNYTSYTGDRYTRNKYEESIKLDRKDIAKKICILLIISIFILVGLINMLISSIKEIKNSKSQIINNIVGDSTIEIKENKQQNLQNEDEYLNDFKELEEKRERLKEEIEKFDIDEEKINELLNELKKALAEYKISDSN